MSKKGFSHIAGPRPAIAKRAAVYLAVAILALAVAQRWSQSTVQSEQASQYAFQMSGKVVQVSDGDSFTLLVEGHRERVRMASIDAPEITKGKNQPGQPMAQAARKALAALIAGKQLRVLCYEEDHYQRNICDVPLDDGSTANQRLVMQGMAWANMQAKGKYLRDPVYLTLETQARDSQLGIWSLPAPVAPWVWRYQCWQQSQC